MVTYLGGKVVKTRWLSALTLSGLLVGGAWAQAPAEKRPARDNDPVSFGTLRTPTAEAARSQAENWLKGAGKTDDATLQAFRALWDQADRPVLDRVGDTLALGDERARTLLAGARDPNAAAPTKVPDMLTDAKQPVFYRANLALAYARALSSRRIYEEALDALHATKPEQVVDPGSYLFHRAVAEYSLLRKKDAQDSIIRLLDDVADAPERYRMVAALMELDLLSWRAKDLGEIARKMDNIERRLELARGGKTTQNLEKDVIARLDEIIKKLENQQKGESSSASSNGGSCPNGGQSTPNNNTQASSPQNDSFGGNGSGPGNVDSKLKQLTENWGKLPEKERARAMVELTRGMPPQYKELIEDYFRKIAQAESKEEEKPR